MVQFYTWLVWKIARPLDCPAIVVRLLLVLALILVLPIFLGGMRFDRAYLDTALWYGGSLCAIIVVLAWFFRREEFQRPSRLDDWLLSREKEKQEAIRARRRNRYSSEGGSVANQGPMRASEERYCGSCGLGAKSGDLFCSSCGKSLAKNRTKSSSVSFLDRARRAVPAWLFGLVIGAVTTTASWAYLEYYFSDGKPHRIHWMFAAAMYVGGTLAAAVIIGVVAGVMAWLFWPKWDD